LLLLNLLTAPLYDLPHSPPQWYNPLMRTEIIGDATLYLGDCREVVPALNGVDAVVTSPPYNQLGSLERAASGMWAQADGGVGFVNNWIKSGYSDTMPEADYQEGQNSLFSAIAGACKRKGSLFYNHQVRWRDGTCVHPIAWFQPGGWVLRQEIIWDRMNGMMFNARMFYRRDERVLWFTRPDGWKWSQESVGLSTIWRVPPTQNKLHPVAFPVDIPERCIVAATSRGDLVLDPFAGSGTTGIACAKLGRRFIGIEIEPRYFDIACKRITEAQRQGDLLNSIPPADDPADTRMADLFAEPELGA
jgi:site-specific DNA-methyltransferase (adenine-specific)